MERYSMPKQKLHTHEEVFKDHVSGQYDETIFRFRVAGGWIYTHTIIGLTRPADSTPRER